MYIHVYIYTYRTILAVCFSAIDRIRVSQMCCSVLHSIAVSRNVLPFLVLQCVAGCCSSLVTFQRNVVKET